MGAAVGVRRFLRTVRRRAGVRGRRTRRRAGRRGADRTRRQVGRPAHRGGRTPLPPPGHHPRVRHRPPRAQRGRRGRTATALRPLRGTRLPFLGRPGGPGPGPAAPRRARGDRRCAGGPGVRLRDRGTGGRRAVAGDAARGVLAGGGDAVGGPVLDRQGARSRPAGLPRAGLGAVHDRGVRGVDRRSGDGVGPVPAGPGAGPAHRREPRGAVQRGLLGRADGARRGRGGGDGGARLGPRADGRGGRRAGHRRRPLRRGPAVRGVGLHGPGAGVVRGGAGVSGGPGRAPDVRVHADRAGRHPVARRTARGERGRAAPGAGGGERDRRGPRGGARVARTGLARGRAEAVRPGLLAHGLRGARATAGRGPGGHAAPAAGGAGVTTAGGTRGVGRRTVRAVAGGGGPDVGPRTAGRRTHGRGRTRSPAGNARSPRSSPRACPTGRSPNGSSSPNAPWTPMSSTSWPSSVSPPVPRSWRRHSPGERRRRRYAGTYVPPWRPTSATTCTDLREFTPHTPDRHSKLVPPPGERRSRVPAVLVNPTAVMARRPSPHLPWRYRRGAAPVGGGSPPARAGISPAPPVRTWSWPWRPGSRRTSWSA